jgi:IS5 family transposase
MSTTTGQHGFFDIAQQLDKIHEINGFLANLNAIIDWQIFRSDLNKVRDKERRSNAGRPAFDVELMFKILILKTLYNLSDDQTELQIRDRLSFRAFLGLNFCDRVPDAKTIWKFSEDLKNLGLERVLFDRFNRELARLGFKVNSGLIVDSTLIEVPTQHNTKAENAQITNGEIPATLAENPHVLSQKDTEARWTKKNNESYFGYKDHTLTDEAYKFVQDYAVTEASVHDSVPHMVLMPLEPAYPDQEAFGDSAYSSKAHEEELLQRGYLPMLCEKGCGKKLLTEAQRKLNKMKSRVRCRIEHLFGSMKNRCRDEVLRSIGIKRASFWIGLRNLAYNMGRLVSLKCPKGVRVR